MGKNAKNKTKNKINLVFDEKKRKDFLSGFHKRKLQRKKKAQELLEKKLKEEKKRIKAELREQYKKLVVSHRTIPELETLLKEEYEDGDVNVKVEEISTNEIAKKNHWIGANQPKYEEESSENEVEDSILTETNEIPGMELKKKRPLKDTKTTSTKNFQSEKEIKKLVKKEATKKVKKSKVFQKKNRLERKKQKKKSDQLKERNEKKIKRKVKRR